MGSSAEQDISAAMAGLRQQFRQQFDARSDRSNGSGRSGLSGTADPRAALPIHSASRLGVSPVDGGRLSASLSHSAAVSVRSSEASTARDDMLDDLAKLRRDLEAGRAQQTAALVAEREAAVQRERQQVQVQASAAEAAIADLRQDVAAQQASIADLRRDVSLQQELMAKITEALDGAVSRMDRELTSIRASQAQLAKQQEQHRAQSPSPESVDDLSRSVRQLSAANACVEAALRGEMDALRGALEAAQKAARLEVEREIEALREALGASLNAALKEALSSHSAIAVGAAQTSREGEAPAVSGNVDPGGLGALASAGDVAVVAARVSAVESEARRNASALGQLGEVVRLAQSITMGSDKVMDQLARETSARKASEDVVVAQLAQLERRLAALEEPRHVAADASSIHRPASAGVSPTALASSGSEALAAAAELRGSSATSSTAGQPRLVTEGLKASLEKLIVKVNKTLGGAGVAEAPEAAAVAERRRMETQRQQSSPLLATQKSRNGGQATVAVTAGSVDSTASSVSQSLGLSTSLRGSPSATTSSVAPPSAGALGSAARRMASVGSRVDATGSAAAPPRDSEALRPRQGSPTPAGSRSGAPQGGGPIGASSRAESQEQMRQCIQELREENNALREGNNAMSARTLPLGRPSGNISSPSGANRSARAMPPEIARSARASGQEPQPIAPMTSSTPSTLGNKLAPRASVNGGGSRSLLQARAPAVQRGEVGGAAVPSALRPVQAYGVGGGQRLAGGPPPGQGAPALGGLGRLPLAGTRL
eukprot:TRINITY_DN7730_c0_g6_i1.p1 TRINITY_DN7730_c0_g6~~TRINITY_DN7730_c0_g6_i1.p1  ORF type:complete len:776 (-),score=186.73 TRINITY_DN7730_c0_g6_i1:51-2378(-)